MSAILPPIRSAVKERLHRHLRLCRDAALKTRHLIGVNLLNRRSPEQTAQGSRVHRSTVYRVAGRFRERGEAGLFDLRRHNGPRQVDGRYLETLAQVMRASPRDYRWSRPTWTRELLVRTLGRQTGVTVHVGPLHPALGRIRARRGRPRPTVRPPKGQNPKRWRL